MGTSEPSNERGALLGVISFICGILAAGSAAMIGFTSFTAFNPPGWLRIITMAPFPVVLIAAAGFGLAALKRGSGRVWAILGIVLAGLSVIAFIVMLNVGG